MKIPALSDCSIHHLYQALRLSYSAQRERELRHVSLPLRLVMSLHHLRHPGGRVHVCLDHHHHVLVLRVLRHLGRRHLGHDHHLGAPRPASDLHRQVRHSASHPDVLSLV